MKPSWYSLYNLILALWVGGMAIFTFLVTPAVFRSFGRDMASQIVDRLFPGYFLYIFVLAILAFIVFFMVAGDQYKPAARLSFALLLAAIVINAYVAFKLHPDTLRVKRQVTSFVSESPDSPARRQFARLHGLAASLNLLVFADGVVLLLVGPALKK